MSIIDNTEIPVGIAADSHDVARQYDEALGNAEAIVSTYVNLPNLTPHTFEADMSRVAGMLCNHQGLRYAGANKVRIEREAWEQLIARANDPHTRMGRVAVNWSELDVPAWRSFDVPTIVFASLDEEPFDRAVRKASGHPSAQAVAIYFDPASAAVSYHVPNDATFRVAKISEAGEIVKVERVAGGPDVTDLREVTAEGDILQIGPGQDRSGQSNWREQVVVERVTKTKIVVSDAERGRGQGPAEGLRPGVKVTKCQPKPNVYAARRTRLNSEGVKYTDIVHGYLGIIKVWDEYVVAEAEMGELRRALAVMRDVPGSYEPDPVETVEDDS